MFTGIVLFIVGLALRYFINRRAFNRRNSAGVEQFTSFEAATGNKFIEGAGRIAGTIMLVLGVLVIIMHSLAKG